MLQIQKKLISMNYSKGKSIVPKYIVIHETDNTREGADAQAHYNYWNTNPSANSSVHFVVDDKNIIQLAELYWRCWHVGDNRGYSDITNDNSIGIEICVNSDGDYNKAIENCIDLVKHLVGTLGLEKSNIKRHYDASGKNCPRNLTNKWKWFLDKVFEPKHEKVQPILYIEALQDFLNKIGIKDTDNKKLVVDGLYGDKTKQAYLKWKTIELEKMINLG